MTSPTKFLDNCFFHPIDSRNGGSSNTINSAPQKSVYRQHYNAFCKCSSLSLTRSSAQIEENLLLIDQGTQQTAHVSTNTHVCVIASIYRGTLRDDNFANHDFLFFASEIMQALWRWLDLSLNLSQTTLGEGGFTQGRNMAVQYIFLEQFALFICRQCPWIPIINALLKTVNTSSYPILKHNPKANNNPIPYLTSLTN